MKYFKVKQIRVTAKEWFDKVNGNSYFSAIVDINPDYPHMRRSFSLPFEYGYGEYYLQAAGEKLQELGYLKAKKTPGIPLPALARYCRENKIEFSHSIQHKCLKKEVREWGE